MKKLAFSLIALSFLASACGTPEEDVNSELSLAETVEALDTYTMVTSETTKSFVPTCDEASEAFAQKVIEGDVGRLYVFAQGKYSLQVFSTPNYDKWTEADFETVNKCGEPGSITVQKVLGDSLLWSYPNCSAGAAPNKGEPGYSHFEACQALETELHAYFGL